MSDKVICEECGHEMQIGDWPYCPHERTPKHIPFIPYWDHGVDTKPQWITSLGERWKYMKKNKLEYHSPEVGKPGCEV